MVKIISDSTCDLSQELMETYHVSILPLHILLGDEEYEDRISITPAEIYAWADANKTTPKTSAVGMMDAIELLRPHVEAGDEVVCFTISGAMSTTYNVVRMAAEELDAQEQVFVVDSENLSTGIGLLVIEAAMMAEAGKSGAEIFERMEQLKPLVRSSFVVDTLTYLHRGGRCSAVAAMAGGVLKLHPKIVVENGRMDATKKYRGKMDAVIRSYVKDLEEDMKHSKKDRVFITHSGCSREIIEGTRAELDALGIFDEILVTRAGGVISSHCGPGTLGVLYIAGEEQE